MIGTTEEARVPVRRARRPRLPPGPPASALPAVLRALRRDPLGFLESMTAQHGDVVRIRFWGWNVVLLRHPEHVKHVLQDRHSIYDKENVDYRALKPVLGNGLLTSSGELWLRQRRLVQPAFRRERVAAFGDLMVERTLELVERWRSVAGEGRTVDVQREMGALALDIATRALFGVDVGDQAAVVGRAFETLTRLLVDRFYSWRIVLLLLPWLPTPGNLRSRSARRTLDELVRSIIARRRRQSAEGGDLLSTLLRARDEGERGMSDRQLRDEVVTLLLAGHETTAMALTWTWYLLAKHPGAADRLRRELVANLGARPPTAGDLPALGYTRRVVEESMRLRPPVWLISRRAREADEIGGWLIPRNTIVALSPYLTHRVPDLWPQPERFDPERFTPERVASRPRFAYFPFAGGPRQCIGNDFALAEATLALATIAQRYRLRLTEGRDAVPEPLVTLRVRGGLPMMIDHAPPAGQP